MKAAPDGPPRPRGTSLAGPPTPTLAEIFDRLGAGDVELSEQKATAAEAAYAGRLSLGELKALREANYLPYSKDE